MARIGLTVERLSVRGLGKILRWIVLIVVAVVAVAGWGIGAAFLVGLLVGCLTGLINTRISIAAGLLCIAACPILQIAERYAWLQQSILVSYYASSLGLYSLNNAADASAVWAYYLLCIGIGARLIQHLVHVRNNDA